MAEYMDPPSGESDRLRECLRALADVAGTDVYRFEIRLSEDRRINIIVTTSRSDDSERRVGDRIVAYLDELFAQGKDTKPPEDAP